MSPDDPRHGTNAGYIAHFFKKVPMCDPCRNAHADYQRKRDARHYLERTDSLYVNRIGSLRRLQALVALGHRLEDIDAALGRSKGWASLFLRIDRDVMLLETFKEVAAAYERLSMTLPAPYPLLTRTKKMAERRGWAPPLAWDDIDDENEQPKIDADRDTAWERTVDHAVIERVISEAKRPRKLTWAESAEVVRRLLARGLSWTQIEDVYGFKVERYIGKDAA